MKKEILYQEIARTIACQIKKGVWKAGENYLLYALLAMKMV